MTDIKPKPMDPERLAHLRGLSDPLCFTSAFQADIVAELLADRDYHARISATFEAERDDAMQHRGWLEQRRREDGEQLDALRAEVARLRARVRVEAEDVERAGAMWGRVVSWLLANGWEQQKGRGLAHHAGGSFVHWKRKVQRWVAADVVCVYEHEHGESIANTVNSLARHHGRPGLDILDEMAAIEVPS
jgi:hypothetical protein